MPSIAMVLQRYYPHIGGAEIQLQRLIPHLQARGFNVSVVTRKEKGLKSFEVVDGVSIYRVPSPGPKLLAGAIFTLLATRLLSRLRPNIIHAHEILAPTSAAFLTKHFHGWPFITTIHRGGVKGDIYKIKRRLFGLRRFKALLQEVDAFIVISREIDDELAELNVPFEKRIFIPNGVDIEAFAPPSSDQKKQLREQLSIPFHATVIVYLGRLVAEKRVDHLLRIWPQIKTVFPETLLLIIGTGSEETLLQGLAGDGVRFTGQIRDSVRYLKAADLYVSPSSTEGLSLSLLEALSCGLSVLATSVGGARDVIQHNVNGYLIPPEDLSSLKNGLLTLLGDEALRTKLGQGGRQRIISDYSLDSVADKLSDLYAGLIKAKN